MPPRDRGRIDRSFLGETALRLGRLLRVGGLISPQFESEEKVQPVVLVGDATGIGYRGQSLRSWSYGEVVAAAAGFTSKLAIKAPPGDGIIIDGWIITTPTSGLWRIGIIGANEVDPFPIVQTNIRWTERLMLNNENTGIFTIGHNTDALTYGAQIASGHALGNQVGGVLPIPVMLPAGGTAIVSCVTVNALLAVTIVGRSL